MKLYGTELSLENADSFTKTDLMHIALTYKGAAERLTLELVGLEQVGE